MSGAGCCGGGSLLRPPHHPRHYERSAPTATAAAADGGRSRYPRCRRPHPSRQALGCFRAGGGEAAAGPGSGLSCCRRACRLRAAAGLPARGGRRSCRLRLQAPPASVRSARSCCHPRRCCRCCQRDCRCCGAPRPFPLPLLSLPPAAVAPAGSSHAARGQTHPPPPPPPQEEQQQAVSSMHSLSCAMYTANTAHAGSHVGGAGTAAPHPPTHPPTHPTHTRRARPAPSLPCPAAGGAGAPAVRRPPTQPPGRGAAPSAGCPGGPGGHACMHEQQGRTGIRGRRAGKGVRACVGGGARLCVCVFVCQGGWGVT